VALLALAGLVAPDPAPSAAALGLAVVGAAGVAAAVHLAVRAVVARRQPSEPADIVAADDAIRASAVHQLAGGGTAAILLVAAQVAWATAHAYDGPGWIGAATTTILLLGALVAWRWSAYRQWQVRRGAAAVPR
jgi:hypothetical protein